VSDGPVTASVKFKINRKVVLAPESLNEQFSSTNENREGEDMSGPSDNVVRVIDPWSTRRETVSSAERHLAQFDH
jgi:hypothetical protein